MSRHNKHLPGADGLPLLEINEVEKLPEVSGSRNVA